MSLRKILLAAAVAAPLALSPVSALAQERGSEKAADVSNAHGGPTVTALPAGIEKKVEGDGVVPFGLARRYTPPTPQAEPGDDTNTDPGTEPTEPCSGDEIVTGPDGNLYVQHCDGTLEPLFLF